MGLVSRGQKSGQRRGWRAVGRRGEGRQLGNNRRAGSKGGRRKTGKGKLLAITLVASSILPDLVRRRVDVV